MTEVSCLVKRLRYEVPVFKKGIQVKFFTADQNVAKSLKCIFTKFEVSTFFRFREITITVQN